MYFLADLFSGPFFSLVPVLVPTGSWFGGSTNLMVGLVLINIVS